MFNYYQPIPKSAQNFRNLDLGVSSYMAIVILPNCGVCTFQTWNYMRLWTVEQSQGNIFCVCLLLTKIRRKLQTHP